MDISEYTKQQGQFLKAEDVMKKSDATWEITEEGKIVTSEKFNTTRLHLPLNNGEDEYIFDCSKTNARTIEEKIGTSDTTKWVGKLLKLGTYKTKTSEGKLTDAINVEDVV